MATTRLIHQIYSTQVSSLAVISSWSSDVQLPNNEKKPYSRPTRKLTQFRETPFPARLSVSPRSSALTKALFGDLTCRDKEFLFHQQRRSFFMVQSRLMSEIDGGCAQEVRNPHNCFNNLVWTTSGLFPLPAVVSKCLLGGRVRSLVFLFKT